MTNTVGNVAKGLSVKHSVDFLNDLKATAEWKQYVTASTNYIRAHSGAATRHRLLELIERFEAETGQDGVFSADTVEADGRIFVHQQLIELIKKQDDCASLELALATTFPTPDATRQFNEEWPSAIAKYCGKPNSEELLREKSEILAWFIFHNLDVAMTIYPKIRENAPELSYEQEVSIRLEEAALWYRVIDELTHRYLSQERPLFMDYFEDELAYCLALQRATPNAICTTLTDRMNQYGPYRRWVPKGEAGGAAGTLLWEAAKHIGEPFGESRNGIFLIYYGNLFLNCLERAFVYELLTGRTDRIMNQLMAKAEERP